MKKIFYIFILISIIAGFLLYNFLDNSEYLLKSNDYEIINSNMKFLSRKHHVNSSYINYNGIKYISLDDLIELINKASKDKINYKKGINKLEIGTNEQKIIINMKDNLITLDVDFNKVFYPYERTFLLLNEEYSDIKTELHIIDLNKYSIKLIKHESEYYLPYELVGIILFGRHVTFSLDEEIVILSAIDSFSYELNIDKGHDLSEIHKRYLLNLYITYLDTLYNYRDIEIDLLNDIYIDIVNDTTNDEFYNIITNIFKPIYKNDPHTSVIYGQSERNYNEFYSRYNDLGSEYIPFETDEFNYKIIDDILYVRVPTFKHTTYGSTILELASENKVSNLIIDVRNNFGGGFNNVVNLLEYLTNDQIYQYDIIDHKSNNIIKTEINIKRNNIIINVDNMVVLTNNFSISAASRFPMNVKENKLGTIIGEVSNGAHSLGSLYFLSDGSLLQMSSGPIHVSKDRTDLYGITPDIIVKDVRIDGKDAILEAAVDYINNK